MGWLLVTELLQPGRVNGRWHSVGRTVECGGWAVGGRWCRGGSGHFLILPPQASTLTPAVASCKWFRFWQLLRRH